MLLILISNWSNLKDGFKKPELIISKVTLKNECSITSDAFVVVHQKTKRIFYFSNNLSRIKLHENDMIRLAISPAGIGLAIKRLDSSRLEATSRDKVTDKARFFSAVLAPLNLVCAAVIAACKAFASSREINMLVG